MLGNAHMTSEKQIIAIDVDEVLAPFVPSLIRWHNDNYGSSLKVADFFSYDFWNVWGGTREEAIVKVLQFCKTKYFIEMPPISGSVKAIKSLCKKYNLYIVTSRRESAKDITVDWINRHYPRCFKNILFGNHYSDEGISIPKPELCQKTGASIFIDDSLQYTSECAAEGMRVFLFGNYPWNQSTTLDKNIQRVEDWSEMEKILLP